MKTIKKIILGQLLLISAYFVVYLLVSFIAWEFMHPFGWIIDMPEHDAGDRFMLLFCTVFINAILYHLMSKYEEKINGKTSLDDRKTIYDYLSERLPPSVCLKAFRNMRTQTLTNSKGERITMLEKSKTVHADSLRDAVFLAFKWEESEEGIDYWRRVYETIYIK